MTRRDKDHRDTGILEKRNSLHDLLSDECSVFFGHPLPLGAHWRKSGCPEAQSSFSCGWRHDTLVASARSREKSLGSKSDDESRSSCTKSKAELPPKGSLFSRLPGSTVGKSTPAVQRTSERNIGMTPHHFSPWDLDYLAFHHPINRFPRPSHLKHGGTWCCSDGGSTRTSKSLIVVGIR